MNVRIEMQDEGASRFVDAIPSTEVEDIGTTEWTVSKRGTFLVTEAEDGKVGIEGGIGGVTGESTARYSSSTVSSAEDPRGPWHVHKNIRRKVISSAVGREVE